MKGDEKCGGRRVKRLEEIRKEEKKIMMCRERRGREHLQTHYTLFSLLGIVFYFDVTEI